MTELIIDGIHAILPKSFSIQVKRENPLITKNGEYTYDITLDLTNSVNADLYRHINRLNFVARVSTKRSAVLIADNRVYCNGTEVITGWTEDTVTIQIASGNSELNFVIGGDREIASLQGMPNTDFTKTAEANLNKSYPDVTVCFPPVNDLENGIVANNWSLWGATKKLCADTFAAGPKFAQPYMCAYIKEVLKAIGYNLTLNQLEGTPYQYIYIVQTAHQQDWAQMLPGWTVVDFLEQIELLFGGVFVVDNRDKTVSFRFRSNFYNGGKSVHVQTVQDDYEAEVDTEPAVEDLADANVSYKLDDTEFWRWQRLSKDVLKYAKSDVIPSSFSPGINDRIDAWFQDVAHQKTDTIYLDEARGVYYLFVSMPAPGASYQPPPHYRMVNRFEDLFAPEHKTDYELEIVPATLERTAFPLQKTAAETDTYNDFHLSIPAILASGVPAAKPDGSLADMIVNNTSVGKAAKHPIRIAVYSGLMLIDCYDLSHVQPTTQYPYPYIDTWYIDHNIIGREWFSTLLLNAKLSLRLQDFLTYIYKGTYNIDFAHGIKIQSFDPNVYNPRSVFEIRNKRYICQEIEYTLDANGRKGAWRGVFYPIKIDDTAADQRWILTDGRWRDGGVWLDNGRWLDG